MNSKTITVDTPQFLPPIEYFYNIYKVGTFIIDDTLENEKYDSPINTIYLTKNVKLSTPILHVDLPYYLIKTNNNIRWQKKVLNKIIDTYKKTKYFQLIFSYLEDIIAPANIDQHFISDLNLQLIQTICKLLHINSKIKILSNYNGNIKLLDGYDEDLRKAEITKYFNGKYYLLKNNEITKFNVNKLFIKNNIELIESDFKQPSYNKNEKTDNISIIDILFQYGIEKSEEIVKNARKL
jgi:hypothetical protein